MKVSGTTGAMPPLCPSLLYESSVLCHARRVGIGVIFIREYTFVAELLINGGLQRVLLLGQVPLRCVVVLLSTGAGY